MFVESGLKQTSVWEQAARRLFVCLAAPQQLLFKQILSSPLSSIISRRAEGREGKKSLFSWNHSERNIIQSPVWDCLAKIMEISVIVWGRQTLGRWQAAGKYRWRRQPEGQYSLLYNLSQAALNYLAAAATAAGPRQQAPAHRSKEGI